jgi:hypothetical protein
MATMRRRYRWWLLAAGLLAIIIGVAGSIFRMSQPNPPKEVADIFEQLQVGMTPIEVQQTLGLYYPLDIVNGVTEREFLGHWRIAVYLEKGWLLKKWLVPPQGEPGWRIAWLTLNAKFPLLRKLPF